MFEPAAVVELLIWDLYTWTSLISVDDLAAFIYKYKYKQMPVLGLQEYLDIGIFMNMIQYQKDLKSKAAAKNCGSSDKTLV